MGLQFRDSVYFPEFIETKNKKIGWENRFLHLFPSITSKWVVVVDLKLDSTVYFCFQPVDGKA